LLNWDDVRIFLALARNPKLGAAAKALAIDPTTLSRRMARLAQSTNATLFEQHDGQQVLTQRGRELLSLAEKAEAAMLEVQEAKPKGEMAGLVRVAVPESFGMWFLGERIKAFQDAYPNIDVELISPSWYYSPLKREVDVAILSQRPVRGPLTTRRLVNTPMKLYASRAYLDAHPPIRTLEDLAGHRFVGYVRDILPSAQLDRWSELVPGINSNFRTTSIAIQAKAVASGAGLGVLPYYVGLDDPSLVPILSEEVRMVQGFWLVVREDVRYNGRIDVFVSWLVKLVRDNLAFFYEKGNEG
jgi:DNA-binding transcriptional LysR family regulator